MKRATLILAALVLLLGGVGQARAGFLYDNGAPNGTNAWDVTYDIYGNTVTDSFTLSSASTLTQVQLGLWSYIYAPGGVGWSIGTSPYASNDGSGSATLSNTATGIVNGYNSLYESTFSLNLTLAAGTYYLTLSEATTNPYGYDTMWAESDGASLAYTSNNQIPYTGPIGSESFQIYGSATNPAPEPASLILLGTAGVSFAGYYWRRRKQALKE